MAVLARGRHRSRPADLLLIALPAYVGLQLIPLPVGWLRVLSPARASLEAALAPVGLGSVRAPLSASPALTTAHLMRLLCYVAFYFLIRELSRRFASRIWIMAWPVLAVGAAEAALGLVQLSTGSRAAGGTFVNPNHFACFLEMALPFPLAMAAIPARRGHDSHRESVTRALMRCALIAVAALVFLGALYSLSRMSLASILASLAVLAILIPVARGGLRKAGRGFGYLSAAGLIVALGLAMFVSAPGALLERLSPSGSQDPVTADARIAIWRETIPMTADYRVFGSGLGTYISVFQKYRGSAPQYLVDYAHNDYLQLLAELGIAGFVIAAAAAVLILLRIGRSVVAAETAAGRLLACACAAALAALMLSSAVDFDFYIPANAMLGAWIAGMGAGNEC